MSDIKDTILDYCKMTGFICGIVILIAILVFICAIGGTLVGAFIGFVVSITPYLGDAVINGFAIVGTENANLIDIGAMVGFIGGIICGFVNGITCRYDK